MTTRCSLVATILWTLLLACFVHDGTTFAANGSMMVMPQPMTINGKPINSYSTKSGLQISIDLTWVGNRGYRPVQVTLSSPKPVTADIQITVRFHAGFWRSQGRSITVEQDLEMLQGSSSVTTTLLVPQYVDWDTYGWEVWVDGKKDKQLTLERLGFAQPNPGNAQYAALMIQNKIRGPLATQPIPPSPAQIDVLSPSFSLLPEKWIGYSSLDMVVAYPDDLEQLSQRSPEKFAEMLRWVRAGGNLWVFDVGKEYEKLTQLESSLGLRPKQPKGSEPLSLEQRNWRFLPLSGQARQGADALAMLDGRKKIEHMQPLALAGRENRETLDVAADSRRWFVARAHGLGTITAFRERFDRSSLPDSSPMEAVQQSLLAGRIYWGTRHGNDPGQANSNFHNLLIPDVGSAPVFEFQLLISLFVIGIGPLNYWVLKRRHQLPLMLVTVPVAALAATVLLFAYGIVSDGFGIRVRARSVTLIDQAAGEVACWARLSYYAGLAPAKGLKMPDDTAIYPINPLQSGNSRFGRQYIRDRREVEWGEQQDLTRGWLASRTPTQYLTITARASDKRLLFEPQEEGLSVTNKLGVDIVLLAVQDHDGNFYLDEAIDTDASTQLKKSDLIAVISRLRTPITENAPEFPVGFVVSRRPMQSWSGSSMNNSYVPSSNLMETQIKSVISPLADGLGHGAYVAITTKGIELSLGLDDAIETNGFHVVRGSWSDE